MENLLQVFKGVLSNFLISSVLTLSLTSLFATIFRDKIKLPFDTFWNKYIISIWSICFIILTVLRHYDLHKNKMVGIAQFILAITGFFYAKGIFTSEIIVLFMRIILVVFFIEIVI